jgi:hypothetical protein
MRLWWSFRSPYVLCFSIATEPVNVPGWLTFAIPDPSIKSKTIYLKRSDFQRCFLVRRKIDEALTAGRDRPQGGGRRIACKDAGWSPTR